MNLITDVHLHFYDKKNRKVTVSLVNHVYMQANIALLASLFCACVLFVGLFGAQQDNTLLFLWGGFFIIVTILRMMMVAWYEKGKDSHEKKVMMWRNLYIVGSGLGGISWGLIGVLFMPHGSTVQQALMVLMLAGVTAGAVPLSAAIPTAAIAFLIFSIAPFIIAIALLKNNTYLLFDLALFLYLIYSIVLTVKVYHLIKNIIILKFQNDFLLSDLEITNKRLERTATHDPLTQVANRILFKRNLEQAIKRAKKGNTKLALLYIDLDHFKSANDQFGHEAGDHILITIIDRLKKLFRKDDHIARLGGDELAIIIENVKNRDEIEDIAQKICRLVADPIKMKDIHLQVSASIGVGIFPEDGSTEENLLRYSDKSMYCAKQQGGNRFHLGEESNEVR